MGPKRGVKRAALAIEREVKLDETEVKVVKLGGKGMKPGGMGPASIDKSARVIDATSKLIKIFTYLDAVLNVLDRRDIPGVWEKVKDGVEAMLRGTNVAFTLSDFATILTICPSAYLIEWKDVPKDPESQNDLYLCISIAPITAASEPSGPSSGPSRSLPSETRIDIFQELLYQKLNQLKEILPAESAVTIVPDPAVIPVRPVRPSVELHVKGNAPIIPEKSKTCESEAMEVVNETINLHDMAIARGKLKLVEDEQYHNQRRHDIKLERMRSLTALCDVLRTAARSKGRILFPLRECIEKYKVQFNISKNEFYARLKLVNEIVPEFLCIIPMNQHVPVDTLRINLDAPYTNVRAKLSDRNCFKQYLEDESQS